MDIRKVKKLIELLEESGIAEIEITEGEEGVRISRYPRNMSMPAPQMHFAAAPVQAAPAPAPAPAGEAPPPEQPKGHTVTAPMVGTFYASPAPNSAPFAPIGSTVAVGDTLCIIEAMKMMNQIEADKAGRVTAVLAKNGEPVEYGQPLFIIQD
jgi:acetyl-CoA carboxylase biotin carboxyl carrier protein